MIRARIGRHSLARLVRTERHPDPLHRRLLPQYRDDLRQDSGCRFAGRKLPTDLEQRTRLALSGPGDLGPRPLERDELTNHDPDEKKENEVQPFAWVGNREGVQREHEEEVVEQERRDGSDDGAPCPGDERSCDDGREIDSGGIRNANALQDSDRERCTPERRNRDGDEPRQVTSVESAHWRIVGPAARLGWPRCSDQLAFDATGHEAD